MKASRSSSVVLRLWIFGAQWHPLLFPFYHFILHKFNLNIFRATFVWNAKENQTTNRLHLRPNALESKGERRVNCSQLKRTQWVDKCMESQKPRCEVLITIVRTAVLMKYVIYRTKSTDSWSQNQCWWCDRVTQARRWQSWMPHKTKIRCDGTIKWLPFKS